MADHTSYVETTVRVVYRLPSPTNWTEVGKVESAIRQDMVDRGVDPKWDDAVTVEAGDDEILFWFALPPTKQVPA